MPKGSETPWSYFLIRLLFKFVLKIFYGTIVVEGTENIPERGKPWYDYLVFTLVEASHCLPVSSAQTIATH